MGYDSILYEQVDDIVKIMMNRPEKANAQDFHMFDELTQMRSGRPTSMTT